MLYKLLFLPVDKPITDGDTVINQAGDHFTYDHNNIGHLLGVEQGIYKHAEPFIVSFDFNKQEIVGRPTKSALKWLKAGMEIKSVDCTEITTTDLRNGEKEITIAVKCPVCGVLH